MNAKRFGQMVKDDAKAVRFTGLVAVLVLMNLSSAWAQVFTPRPPYQIAVPYQAIDIGPVNQLFLGGLSNSTPLKAVGNDANGRPFECTVNQSNAQVACILLAKNAAAAAVRRDGVTAVGYTSVGPAVWSNGSQTDLTLPTGPDYYRSCLVSTSTNQAFPNSRNSANALNDVGLAAGQCHSPGGVLPVVWNLFTGRPFLLQTQSNPSGLPANGVAFGVNNSGKIVGLEGIHAAMWTSPYEPPVNLGLGDYSSASGISNTGFISGYAQFEMQTRGFVKPPVGPAEKTMHTNSSFDNSNATKVNNDGLAVGYMKTGNDWNTARAAIWNSAGAVRDLTLAAGSLPSGTVLTYAADINDNGDILVVGTVPNQPVHGFVLLRTSTPLYFGLASLGY